MIITQRKTLDNWAATMRLANAGTLSGQAASNCQAYYEVTLTGIAKQFYDSFKRSNKWADWYDIVKDSKNPLDFAIPLYEQFCGSITGHNKDAKQRVKANLEELGICDMKYFEEYFNEYQKYYCCIGELDNTAYINAFSLKFPEPWRSAVDRSLVENSLEIYTLGSLAERVREVMREQCYANLKARMTKKQLKGVQDMCPKILETPTNWGCLESRERTKFSKKKSFYKKRPFQKKNYRFKKISDYQKGKKFPNKKIFKKKFLESKPEEKKLKF